MDDMPVQINHDVAVMAILDLQQKAEHGIASHASHEIPPCFLKKPRTLGQHATQQISGRMKERKRYLERLAAFISIGCFEVFVEP